MAISEYTPAFELTPYTYDMSIVSIYFRGNWTNVL